MGSAQSAPTDKDFKVKHDKLCSYLIEKVPVAEHSFTAPKKPWRKQTTKVNDLGLTLQPEGKEHLLVKDKSGEVVAVFQALERNVIQICSTTPTNGKAAGDYKGTKLYEYARATRNPHDRKHITLKVEGVTFRIMDCRQRGTQVVKRNGVVCASVKNDASKDTLTCRIGPHGIEPALLVTLLACQDKFREVDKDFLVQNAPTQNFKIDTIL